MSRTPWGARAGWPRLDVQSLADDRPLQWIDLASPDGAFAGSGGVAATVGAQDPDGWHVVTITGAGAAADGAAEMRYRLFSVRDIYGDVADLSTGDYLLQWRLETAGPDGGEDVLYMAGPVVMSGTIATPTAVEGVILHGWQDQSAGTVRRSSTTGTSATNTTTAATTSRIMEALWLPERGSSAQLGGHVAIWSASSGAIVTSANDVLSTSVSRASVWRLGLALGTDGVSTTPSAVSIRLAARAIRLTL